LNKSVVNNVDDDLLMSPTREVQQIDERRVLLQTVSPTKFISPHCFVLLSFAAN